MLRAAARPSKSTAFLAAGGALGRALALAAALSPCALGSTASRAQAVADPLAASIVGVACVDLDEDDRCGASDLPLGDAVVRASNGLAVRTDARGRFHVAAVGGERALLRADGAPIASPGRVGVSLDAEALGPSARPPPMRSAPLPPGAVVAVDLPARLPERVDAAPLAIDRAAARVRGGASSLVVGLPLRAAPGHVVDVDGVPVVLDASGVGVVEIALAHREASRTVVDRAPDGRARLWHVRVLRVPRAEGDDRVVLEEPVLTATFDLPPPGVGAAAGRLLVPVRAPAGVEVEVGAVRLRVPQGGVAYPWIDVDGAPLSVRVGAAHASFALPKDAWPSVHARLFGDMRVGAAGTVPFAQGSIDGAVAAPTPGGAAAAGFVFDDDVARAALDGRLLLQSGRAGAFGRFVDPELHFAAFGDDSRAQHENPGRLSLWARVTSAWGEAGLGPARAPLDDVEVGRIERPALGPYVDLAVPLGPVAIGVEGAVDGAAIPGVDAAPTASAHDEIESSGGRVYWLSHALVAPASERVVVAAVDALTGLVVDRRVLVRGVDYDIDYASGRLVLAAPLGLVAAVPPAAARPGSRGAGAQSRLVVDYAHSSREASANASGSARVFMRAGDVDHPLVEGGVGGGLTNEASLFSIDATARPHELLTLSASVARSGGDWTQRGAVGARSLDAGLSWAPPLVRGGGGDAAALRLSAGDAAQQASLWGSVRQRGFTDGSGGVFLDEMRGGGGGAIDIWEIVQLSGSAEARSGADPASTTSARLTTLDGSTRMQATVGPVRAAFDTLERRATSGTSGAGGAELEGAAVALGGELGVRPLSRVEVFAGHLQRVWTDGAGPGARDPTFTYGGARVALDDDIDLDALMGVHPDFRPEGRVQLLAASDDGAARYGGFGVTTDDPWVGRSLSSVTGGRQSVGPRADVYAEQRTSSTEKGVLAGRAAGVQSALGPLSVGMSWESAERVVDAPRTVRHAITGRGGIESAPASAHVFAEIARVTPALGIEASQWAIGAAGRAQATQALSFGARVLAGEGTPLDGAAPRPFGEMFIGATWRTPSSPVVLAQYSLRADRRVADQRYERLHLVRASAAAGALPHLAVVVGATLAQDESTSEIDDTTYTSQAALTSIRFEVPIWYFVPAIELGARAVAGAGVDVAVGSTARAELALQLGPAAIGAGVVLAGYTGSGLEPLTLAPLPPPIYLVLRGAFG